MSTVLDAAQKKPRWVIALIVVFVFLVLSLFFTVELYMRRWNDRVLPGVAVGTIDLGGRTREEATELLERAVARVYAEGIPFTYQSKSVMVPPLISAPGDPDITYAFVHWDVPETVNDALAVGRDASWWREGAQHLAVRFSGRVLPARVTLNSASVRDVVSTTFADYSAPAINAELALDSEKILVIHPESEGYGFVFSRIEDDLKRILASFSGEPILLTQETLYPTVTAEALAPFKMQAEAVLAHAPWTLTFEKETWPIDANTLASWMRVTDDATALRLTIDSPVARDTLAAIATTIKREPEDARFILTNGRVTEFSAASAGRSVDSGATMANIEEVLMHPTKTSIPLVVITTAPTKKNEDVNDLGIVELLGVGHSNFAGSPPNRRHNIAVGARAVHGVLIPPGEEFSLVNTLGDINAASGYKQELVIKGNKTVPEYGGGLCQIGTTTFRGALATGLPVTERQNHAYSVMYYLDAAGKPGTDATIYGPHPDFRFMNDTRNHILIQTRIDGDDVYFEFWGKKDGRNVAQSDTKVWDVRKPPAARIIETTDLPVGKKRCTEGAHDGMRTEFTYTIAYASGEKKEQVFASLYRPWQAVCLVGVEKPAEVPSL